MRRWIYPALLCALTVSAFQGCARRAIKKTVSPDQAAQAAPGQEEEEASLRGKEYRSVPEIQTVYFDYDGSELTDETRTALKRNAEWLKNNPKVEIKIEGHCDDRGTDQYNLALGQRRANRVRDYYKALGIRMGRMSTISYGEEKSICAESTEECWQRNRRAETLPRKK